MLHAVIMAGGSGTRFWPLSRQALPKQFLQLSGERSLIQRTLDRYRSLIPPDCSWVVTNRRFLELTQQHLPEIPGNHILQEPCGRNTAPCIGLAALCILAEDPQATLLVMPADHVIEPDSAFLAAVQRAADAVEDNPDCLVLMGITPTSPATGFGYIERNVSAGDTPPPLADDDVPTLFPVASFREKPDRATAEEYLRRGTFSWNSGIFVWKGHRILAAIREYEPEIGKLLDDLSRYVGTDRWDDALGDLFPRMKSISIDHAVLERDRNIAVLEATFAWDDVGGWESIGRHHPADEAGNVVIGRHAGLETGDCIIHSSGNHLIATIGMHDCLIVHTPDATLIANRHDDNAVRQLVELLQAQGMHDVL